AHLSATNKRIDHECASLAVDVFRDFKDAGNNVWNPWSAAVRAGTRTVNMRARRNGPVFKVERNLWSGRSSEVYERERNFGAGQDRSILCDLHFVERRIVSRRRRCSGEVTGGRTRDGGAIPEPLEGHSGGIIRRGSERGSLAE